MDANGYPPLPDEGDRFSWLRNSSVRAVPLEELPTAPGPIIYEGFVPDQSQHEAAYTADFAYGSLQNGQLHSPHLLHSQYPPLGDDADTYRLSGDPVQPATEIHVARTISSRLTPIAPFSYSARSQNGMNNDETSLDEDENSTPIEIDVSRSDTSQSRGRGRGRGRGRARGTRRGPGRPRQQERQRGGWNKGSKTGLRAVLDPGEEFNVLHEEATTAFIDQQDHEKALELILQAISINPEIYSAHVLLSEIYYAKNDDERAIAALFSGAHASPNDPDVWHQLADSCLQRSVLDRFTMLKQASYCFQRLLQIDQNDHDARFQKAAISRELGHHAKALKDLDYLLQKMPHNSSILRQVAEVCLDINDPGRAIGLYDDALEHQRLHGIGDEDAFSWADLIVYVDLVARPDGAIKAIQTLKTIARKLLGREDEVYWESYMQDDREWDAENTPRRIQVPQFEAGRYPLERYGVGLQLELRVKLGEFRLKSGNRQEALSHFAWLAPDDRSEGAPLYEYSDLFLQVADILRGVKEYEQALRYYEAVHSLDACDDVDFWLGFGACSYVCEKRDQALMCFETAKERDPTSGEARTQLSKLYAAKGDRANALLLARSAIVLFESQLPKTDRRRYERKDLREARETAQKVYKEAYKLPKPPNESSDLPKPYFSRRARAKARRVAKDGAEKIARDGEQVSLEDREESLEPPQRVDGLRSREEATKQTTKKRRSNKERTVQNRYETIHQLYSTLDNNTEAMRNGDDVARNIWMDCAEALIEEFRSEKVFYPAERYIRFQGFDRGPKKGEQFFSGGGQNQAQEDVPLPSVESNVPSDYFGIMFGHWLDIFLEYAILLANTQDDGTECYATINAALDCNVWYHSPDAVFQIYTCYLVCALALRDELTLFNTVIRWFMREFIFCTDTYRLFGALHYHFPHPNDKGGKTGQMNNAVSRAGPSQKYLFRQVVGIDSQLPKDYGAEQPDGPVPDFMRKFQTDSAHWPDRAQLPQDQVSGSQVQADLMETDYGTSLDTFSAPIGPDSLATRTYTPKELDIVLLVLYGQILYAGNSFPNALSYFYRAYNIEPKNPMLLFSIALCYIHQMFKRQNENRHMYLLQGWSFFDEYAAVRLEWAENKARDENWPGLVMIIKREIEFNRARCWQMLGMSDLAIRSYGRMLDIRAVKTEDQTDMDGDDKDEHKEMFSMEAAYAMVGMYAINGDIDKAREITEKYLVVE